MTGGSPSRGSEERGRLGRLRRCASPPPGLVLPAGSGLGAQLPSTFLPVVVVAAVRARAVAQRPAQRAEPGWPTDVRESRCRPVGGTQQAHPGRRQPGRVAEHLEPGQQVPVQVGVLRRPRGAHLDVDGVLGAGEVAEPGRGRAGDRAADVVVSGAGLGQGVGQPAPGDLGEHRVVDQFLVGGGRQVADAAGGAVPGLVAVGVVQHDEPGAGDLESSSSPRPARRPGPPTACAHGREPLGRGDVLQHDLRTGPDPGQRVEGGPELGRAVRPLPAPVPRCPALARLVGSTLRRVGR